MLSDAVIERIRLAFARTRRWADGLDPAERARLERRDGVRELTRRAYVDAYWRIRETTPLIRAAIAALEARRDHEAARFWIEGLADELGHDAVHYGDLVRLHGGRRAADAALARLPITPPSAALVGYFHHVARHDPHALCVYRLFLEMFVVEMADNVTHFTRALGRRGTATLALHRGLDVEHVKPCRDYLDRHFRAHEVPRLAWSVDFIGTCLVESQRWIAASLRRAPAR